MKTSDALSALGIHARIDGNTFRIDTRLAGARRFMDAKRDTWDWYTRVNRHECEDKHMTGLSMGRTEMVSQLRASLDGKLDMLPFQLALKKFEQSTLSKRLAPVLANAVPRRKRRLHDEDGDWQYERRNEDAQFVQHYRAMTPAKSVELRADFVCGGHVSGEAVNRYGALVWGISQILERAGVKTRLVCQNYSKGTDLDQTMPTDLRIVLKEPHEYLAPNLIAGCFVEGFYRILCWGIRTSSIDACGKTGYSGMGQGYRRAAVIYSDGVLELTPAAIDESADAMEKALLAAIKH